MKVKYKHLKRVLVKTHVITDRDDIMDLVGKYTSGLAEKGDVIAISESAAAISQGRAIPVNSIKPGIFARLLWRGVRKVNYGTGLRSPYSMQCAINEVGLPRIILASAVSCAGKLMGRRGDFYRIAGRQTAMIDAAFTCPIKPYDQCVILGPKEPESIVSGIKAQTGVDAAIVDVNDIGGSWVVAATEGVNKRLTETILLDNPMGQGTELTPICVIKSAARGYEREFMKSLENRSISELISRDVQPPERTSKFEYLEIHPELLYGAENMNNLERMEE